MFELTEACSQILTHKSPILVTLDGGSGAGKSTIASRLAQELDCVIVPLDDFYAANIPDWEWDARLPGESSNTLLGQTVSSAARPMTIPQRAAISSVFDGT